jgi:hypothetical protein
MLEVTERQSKMFNPEKLATLGREDTGRRQAKQNKTKQKLNR